MVEEILDLPIGQDLVDAQVPASLILVDLICTQAHGLSFRLFEGECGVRRYRLLDYPMNSITLRSTSPSVRT